jgi:hypothetical protein
VSCTAISFIAYLGNRIDAEMSVFRVSIVSLIARRIVRGFQQNLPQTVETRNTTKIPPRKNRVAS